MSPPLSSLLACQTYVLVFHFQSLLRSASKILNPKMSLFDLMTISSSNLRTFFSEKKDQRNWKKMSVNYPKKVWTKTRWKRISLISVKNWGSMMIHTKVWTKIVRAIKFCRCQFRSSRSHFKNLLPCSANLNAKYLSNHVVSCIFIRVFGLLFCNVVKVTPQTQKFC